MLLVRNGKHADTAALLAPLSEGSLQRAMELDDDSLTGYREDLLRHLGTINMKHMNSIFEASESVCGNRNATIQCLDMLLSFARDIVHLSAGVRDIVNLPLLSTLETYASRCTLAQALQVQSAVMETRRAVQRNANNKLAMDCLFIKLAETLA